MRGGSIKRKMITCNELVVKWMPRRMGRAALQRGVCWLREPVDLDLGRTAHSLQGGRLPSLCLPRARFCGAGGHWTLREAESPALSLYGDLHSKVHMKSAQLHFSQSFPSNTVHAC